MTITNRQILLASRPRAEASIGNFRLVEAVVPPLRDGQVLVRHHFLSLDPYMRGRMSEARSYAEPQALDEVMMGGTAGEVVASLDGGFEAGDKVVGMGGWQEYAVVDAARPGALRKVDTTRVPLSAYLGAVGMPGVAAWYGLTRIIAPAAGETVVVSSAAGAVGGVAGQLAKARGCRVVGIAGGPQKCRHVVEDLGFDACIDHRGHDDLRSLAGALEAACPQGIDGHFENVGGRVMDAVLRCANPFSRVAVCGMIAGIEGQPAPLTQAKMILIKRMKVEGFIVTEHGDVWPQALGELGAAFAAGRLKLREDIAQGLQNAPEAFLGLLKGRSQGKQLVRLI